MATKLCADIARKLWSAQRISVVHHWDADGVASAALILRRLGESIVSVKVPKIGLYGIDAIPLPNKESPLLLVLDYGLPGSLYEELADRYKGGLVVIDHHRVSPPRRDMDYCNPVARGEATEEDFPANSLLVYEIIGREEDVTDRILAALGIAGDLAPYIDAGSQHPGLAIARELLEGTGIELEGLRTVAESIDSCYRLLDTRCLERTVRIASRNPLGLLTDEQLARAKKLSQELLEDAWRRLAIIYSGKSVLVYKLSIDAYITSAIGRKLASNEPDKIIVLVHEIPSQKRSIIYVRSITHRLDRVGDRLKSQGVPVAGKTHVLVIDYTGSDHNKYLKPLLQAIHDIVN